MRADCIREVPALNLAWDVNCKRINEMQYLVMPVLEKTVNTVSRIRSSGSIKSREFLKILINCLSAIQDGRYFTEFMVSCYNSLLHQKHPFPTKK